MVINNQNQESVSVNLDFFSKIMTPLHSILKHSVACALLIVCFAIFIQESNARPPWLAGSGVFTQSAECHTDDELLDLCQRCAKLTKSRLAYPACCSTDLKARKWCSDYVYFGRGDYEFY